MFINKDSIQVKIDSMENYISLGQYILEAKYGYNKLRGGDTGRTLSGAFTGSFIGVFPKIIVHFRKLTKSEFELLAPILDSPVQSLKYYDPNKKTTITIETYTGDYEVTNKRIINSVNKNEDFQISFISTKKRV